MAPFERKIGAQVNRLGNKPSLSGSSFAGAALPPPPHLPRLGPVSFEGISRRAQPCRQPCPRSREGLTRLAPTPNPTLGRRQALSQLCPAPSSNAMGAFSHGGSRCHSPSRMGDAPADRVSTWDGRIYLQDAEPGKKQRPSPRTAEGASRC